MCLVSKPATPAPPPPAPIQEQPKPMVSPEEAAARRSGTTASTRRASSLSALRIEVGGAPTGSTGLNIPQ